MRHRGDVRSWALVLIAAAGCGPAEEPKTPRPERPLLSGMAIEARTQAPARFVPLGPEASPITFERMSRFPDPGWQIPRSVSHSPDGKLVTYLMSEEGGDVMALFAFDKATRSSRRLARAEDLLREQRELSREEELRRERQRQRATGISQYRWAKRAPIMIVPHGGDVFILAADGKVQRLTDTAEPEIDPKACDGGERVAFVRGSELFVTEVASRRETALTTKAPAGVTRGQSDFNGQEEFDEPSGHFWSPKCDKIAFLEVDERDVAEVPVVGYRAGKPDVMMQRYPRAGAKNPRVSLGVIDVATRRTTWLDGAPAPAGDKPGPKPPATPPAKDRYLGRVTWTADGKAVLFQVLSRSQREVSLVRADATTGETRVLRTDKSPHWVDLAGMRALDDNANVLWTTPIEGHMHLVLLDAVTGREIRQLTRGDWDVDAIEGVDEQRGRVLFTATKNGPRERHLYSVAIGGGEIQKLTSERGYHRSVVDSVGRTWVDVHSASDRLPKAVVRAEDGSVVGELPVKSDADLESLHLRTPRAVDVKGPDGTMLHGTLLEPRKVEPGVRHPAVVIVYGGPGSQSASDQWAPRLLWQHLADRGFAVFQLDNRGGAGRGPVFEAPIHKKLGEIELADQIAGAEWLASQPFVDGTRLGIYGHSYGGFMAALAMLKTPGRFRAGIAASPVTDWRLYDTGYTERFMSTPQDNEAGYAASDLAKLAGNLKGKLFVVHALMDENVHFQHTAQLVDALVAADKTFDLLVFPGERHGYRSPTARRYALRRVVDYLVENL